MAQYSVSAQATDKHPFPHKTIMEIFQKLTQAQGFFNSRIKYYPTVNGDRRAAELCTFSQPIFNPHHLENDVGKSKRVAEEDLEEVNECSLSDASLRRARKRVFDLAACNYDCNMMLTLTLNGEDFPRDDWNAIVHRLNVWLDNMVRRHGMKYIFVPELHKDGKSIHFHGFVNEGALTLERATNAKTGKPLFQKGRAVYNCVNWKYGFTTAVRLGGTDVDRLNTAKYILKYITKAVEASGKIGGRYYLHGGKLAEPSYEYFNADFDEVEGYEVQITNGLSCKVHTLI